MTSIAIFNADWSNRTPEVNTPEKLVAFLASMVEDMGRPDAFSICECRLSTVTALSKKIHKSYWYATKAIEYANQGHLALFYDSTVLRAVSNFQISDIGKYGFQRFEEIATKKKIVLACVHLPHKKGKEKARNLLKNAMESEKKWADCIKVFGDFNTKPTDLATYFPTFTICIKRGTKTTNKKTSPDNFIAWEKEPTPGHYITWCYYENHELSHYPLLNVEEPHDTEK